MNAAPHTLQLARKVRRRTLVAAVVRRGGMGLVVGCGLGLAGVVLAKLGWLDLPWAWVLAIPAGAGLVVGAAAGLAGRWSLRAAAQRADSALGLRDRLSNALAFAAGDAGPAERLAIRDGEQVAAGIVVSRVVPVRFGSAWAAWPVVLAAAVACGIWAPQRAAVVTEIAQQELSEPERRAAAEVIASGARAGREAVEQALTDRAGAGELARMEEIERELLDGTRDPDEALAEGAREMESLADRVEREAETEAMSDQLAREQLADRVDAGEGASELADALSEGDLQRARDAARDLMNQLDRMSPEERARYAEELERLAEQVRSSEAGQPDPAELAREEALDQALRDQGIEQPESLGGSDDPAELREQLEQQGIEPETAERLADQLAERERRDRAEEQSRRELDELSNAAEQAAERLREEPRPPEQSNGQGEPQPNEPQGEQGSPPEQDNPADQPPEQRQREGGQGEQGQGEQQPGQQGQGEQRQGQQQGEQGQGEEQGDQPTKQEGEQRQSDDGEPGATQREGGAEQQGDAQQQGDAEQQGDRQAGDQPGQPSGERQGEQPQGQPGGEPTQQPGGDSGERGGEPQPGDSQQPGAAPQPDPNKPGAGQDGPSRMTDGQGDAPDRQAIDRLRRQLDRMAERGQTAEERRRNAERLREQAERMLEQASPEQRREMERLARELAEQQADREGAGADGVPSEGLAARPDEGREWDTEPFDARGEPGEEGAGEGQVIAEWYGNDDQAPAGEASSQPAQGAALEEAARGAERALERRAVPRERRELIRRVFERFKQRAAEAQEKQASGEGS